MSNFYKKMQITASKLMTKFKQGEVVYIETVETAGANPWDAPTATPIRYPLAATVAGVGAEYISDLITASDLVVTCGVFESYPKQSGVIEIDGTERQIISVQALPAAGEPVAWRVFVKG